MATSIQDFLRTTFQNVRSSKRTDILHEVVLNELIKNYPDYEKYDWKFEKRIKLDGLGGTFRIDIVGLLKGEIKIAILCKCINSSFGKNSKNYSGNILNDAYRALYAETEKINKVIFVNIYPTICPIFTKTGEITGYNNVAKYKSRTKTSKALNDLYGKKAEEVNIFYDIENLKEKKTKKDFDNINPINISEFKLQYSD